MMSFPFALKPPGKGIEEHVVSFRQKTRCLAYITPEQDLKLEQIRLARREHGERVDKSALIREAIDLLVNQ